ncbi:cysteine-rich with EGF-like domain protein 2-like [Scleropages formosus]|uniref:Cysteine-rich with EGF-like domain protein 2-like n=1 Tax=Scleropages formosus TaxID=113540 RepID=A0A0P7USM3_SCLFO|nr:cysteine-rich with EGF-like domain protein 2-like [Scleropages formosus]
MRWGGLGAALSLLCLLALIVRCPKTDSADLKESCSTCKQITDNFAKGFERTAKKNFGGGNTAWEERKLSKYETSEIRLMEIVEGLCDSSFECNHMVEEHEDRLETWWFKRKTKYPDLFKWFCIESIKVCCPNGTFGPDCNACIGGSERPCHGNGVCNGDGTRTGDGRCSCNHGYQGALCLECVDGYFSEERNDTFSQCTECHPACEICTGPTSHHCKKCKPGWEQDKEEAACNDVDECSREPPPCKGDQYCLNTEGSYLCKDVDECELSESPCSLEHQQCVNSQGSYRCLCAAGFQDRDGVCVLPPVNGERSAGRSNGSVM